MTSRQDRRADKKRKRRGQSTIIRLAIELQHASNPTERVQFVSELQEYADSMWMVHAMDQLGEALKDEDVRVQAAATATIDAVALHDPELAHRATGVGPPGVEREPLEIAPVFALTGEVVDLSIGRCGVCEQKTDNPTSVVFCTGVSESQGKHVQARSLGYSTIETFNVTDLQAHPWRICDGCANAARDPKKDRRHEYFASLGIGTPRRYEDLESTIRSKVSDYLDRRREQKPGSYWIKTQASLLAETGPAIWKA